ncbi:MAG TPA: GNAT family N-acetyltransferase [Thermoanaerobaculia bacterium]|nr:GNAT family N-acetyltransferase [Thermoanaerobaculia bacterium]
MTPPRTERIEFREWNGNDVALASRLWCEPGVMRFLGGPYSNEELLARLEREASNLETYGIQYWPVYVDGEFAGCCGIKPVPDDDTKFEIGFHFLPRFWGRGLAFEAARATMRYATERLHVRELYAGHHPGNESSRRLLEKLGFAQIGTHFFARTGLQHPWMKWSAAEEPSLPG